MALPAVFAFILALLPLSVSAHNFVEGQRVAPVGIAEQGELHFVQEELYYARWNSARLSGKVRTLLHIAGRLPAKEMNVAVTEAIAAAQLPAGRYQTTTIINTDDAIPGSAIFVRRAIESSKKSSPVSQFIIDSKGEAKRAWALMPGSSAVVVLDAAGRVRFAREGALTTSEVQQVTDLLKSLLKQ